MKTIMALVACALSFSTQAKTNFEDIDAWRGVSINALDTHQIWNRIKQLKATNAEGEEVRVYVNRYERSDKNAFLTIDGLVFLKPELSNLCATKFKAGYKDLLAYLKCSDKLYGCDNVFVLKDNQVISYTPVGNCSTNPKLRPVELLKKDLLR